MTPQKMLDEAIELLTNAAPGLHICYPIQDSDEQAKAWWKRRESLLIKYTEIVDSTN